MINLSINLTIDETLNKKILEKLSRDKIDISQYLENLIVKDFNTEIYLGNGYSYNNSIKKIIYNFNEEIILTAIELKIFELLLENKNQIVKLEELEKIWNKKEMSLFTLRNFIKKIRDKTYPELIKSVSNVVYNMVIQ